METSLSAPVVEALGFSGKICLASTARLTLESDVVHPDVVDWLSRAVNLIASKPNRAVRVCRETPNARVKQRE